MVMCMEPNFHTLDVSDARNNDKPSDCMCEDELTSSMDLGARLSADPGPRPSTVPGTRPPTDLGASSSTDPAGTGHPLTLEPAHLLTLACWQDLL